MKDKIEIPSRVRFAIYIATGIMQPVAVYLLAVGVIGELEMALFAAEATFVSGLAALNTTKE